MSSGPYVYEKLAQLHSLFPVAAFLSKKRDFLHIIAPVSVCHPALITASKGGGKSHAQDASRVLGMIAEPTGTDGRPIIRKTPSVTGRHEKPVRQQGA